MIFFDLFRKTKVKKVPRWSDLTSKQRAVITKKILRVSNDRYNWNITIKLFSIKTNKISSTNNRSKSSI